MIIKNTLDDAFEFSILFHFNVIGGTKNGEELDKVLRIEQKVNPEKISEYIKYWEKNIEKISKMNKKEREALLIDMKKNNIISQTDFDRVKNGSDAYIAQSGSGKSNLNVCAEMAVDIVIPFDQTVKIDSEGDERLADTFREKIKAVYEMFGLPEESWMK